MKASKRPRMAECYSLLRIYSNHIQFKLQKTDNGYESVSYSNPAFGFIANNEVDNLISFVSGERQSNAEDSKGQSLLVRAVEQGSLGIVIHLISEGANVNWQDDNGNTVLHIAVEEGNLEILRELLEAGSNIFTENKDGYRAIDLPSTSDIELLFRIEFKKLFKKALADADVDMLEYLLSLENSGIDINKRFSIDDPNIWPVLLSPLQVIFLNLREINAADSSDDSDKRHNYIKCLELLIKEGANVSSIDNKLWQKHVIDVQRLAASSIKSDGVFSKFLLAVAKRDGYYYKDQEFSTDFIESCKSGEISYYKEYSKEDIFLYYKILRYTYYINNGKDANFEDEVLNIEDDPLLSIVSEIVVEGVVINKFDYVNLLAMDRDKLKILVATIYFKPDLNLKYDLIDFLLSINKVKLLEYLLAEINIDISQSDFLYKTLQRRDSCQFKIPLIKMLINYGADLNYKNKELKTPIYAAYRDIKALKLLLEAGADVNAPINSHSHSILDHIYFRVKSIPSRKDAIELLTCYGAKCESRHKVKHQLNLDKVEAQKTKIYATRGSIATDSIADKYIKAVSQNFIKKLSTVFDGKAETKFGRTLILPDDIVHEIGSYFFFKEMKEFLPVCKGRDGTYYGKFKTKEAELKEHGYKIIDVEGDGNCFFRAVSFDLEGVEKNHLFYREITVNELRDNPELYFSEGEDVNAYIDEIRNDESWIDDDRAIHAIANVLNVNIYVFNKHGADILINPRGGEAETSISVFYTGNHYQSVVSNVYNPVANAFIEVNPLAPIPGIMNVNYPNTGNVGEERVYEPDPFDPGEDLLEEDGIAIGSSVLQEDGVSGGSAALGAIATILLLGSSSSNN